MKSKKKELGQSDINDLLTVLATGESSKRLEENLKFVFKYALKYLKIKFKKRRSFFSYTNRFDHFFYMYYFGDVSKQKGSPLKEYYDPVNYEQGEKSVNQAYLKRVVTSELFRKDITRYLKSGRFQRDYLKSLKGKLYKLLIRFDSHSAKNKNPLNKKFINQIKRYFRKNKQCKLPWSKTEIRKSLSDFFSFVLND